jgi:hypothetical protein
MPFFNRVINFSRSLVSYVNIFLENIWNPVTILISGPVMRSDGWHSAAMSEDGQVIVVSLNSSASSGLSHYISTNGGQNWTSSYIGSGYQNYIVQSTAISSNGQKLLALAGRPFLSNDFGATWNFVEGVPGSEVQWFDAAMSSSGSIQTVVGQGTQIYVSTNFGATFTARDSVRGWQGVAMSSDGVKQAAVTFNDRIYISSNSGLTWTPKGLIKNYRHIAMSSDGSVITAVTVDSGIYVSIDSGQNWNAVASLSSLGFVNVAMSSDGSKQTIVRNVLPETNLSSGELYVSVDYGSTWTKKQLTINPSSQTLWGIAMSSDGKKQVAAVIGGQAQRSFI